MGRVAAQPGGSVDRPRGLVDCFPLFSRWADRRKIAVKEANRLGVSSANLVTRHLKLEPTEREKLDAAIAEIDKLYGLASVSFDDSKGRLDLAYDATRICLDCIEEVLTKYAIEVSH